MRAHILFPKYLECLHRKMCKKKYNKKSGQKQFVQSFGIRRKYFVQTFWSISKTLDKHVGFEARLFFIHFGCKATPFIKFNIWISSNAFVQAFCFRSKSSMSKHFGLEARLCPNILDLKLGISYGNWSESCWKTWYPAFVQTFCLAISTGKHAWKSLRECLTFI